MGLVGTVEDLARRNKLIALFVFIFLRFNSLLRHLFRRRSSATLLIFSDGLYNVVDTQKHTCGLQCSIKQGNSEMNRTRTSMAV